MVYLLLGLLLSLTSGAALLNVIEGPLVQIDFIQNPSDIVWKKIDSEHFEVIFPETIEEEAQRVTHLLEKVFPFVTRSLEVAPTRISLILQNQTVTSNGFVSLAPRRSEWFVTPAIDPDLSNTEWLKTLAIHEFRHIVQFQKSRRNFNRYFEWFLGQFGQALGLGLSFPPWYLEGDAVGIETALTRGGRGRLPIFDRDLRALLLSGKDYDYDQTHLGSYKNYIPNHYQYGYFYTSYMRNQEGDMFLSILSDESTRRSYNPLTFYNSYQRLTGQSFETFYASTMEDLLRLWQEKYELLRPTPFAVKNFTQKQGFTSYLYPRPVGDGRYFALKKGLSWYDQFVITGGDKKDEVVVYPGPIPSEYPIKLRNRRFAYVEAEVDPRWGNRDFSRIKVFDLDAKRHIFDLRKTKGRMAVVDDSGTLVMFVEWDPSQGQYIVINDINQKEILRIRYPAERVITSIDWIGNTHAVIVAKGREDQKEILKIDLKEQMEETLLPPDYTNIGFVTAVGDDVLIESPASGIDNIFLLKDGVMKQITSSRFGAYAPVVDNDKLIYNDYTAEGMDIVTKELLWDEEQTSYDSFVPVYEKFAEAEDRDQLERDFFEKKTYPVRPYSELKNAFNFHSWVLLAPPLSSTVTLMAFSRDMLNKFGMTFGGEWDLNERKSKGFVTARWSHYFPVFDLRAAYGGRRAELNQGTETFENEWEEGTFETGVSVPWKYIDGRFIHTFSTRAFSKVIKVTNKLSSDSTQIRDGALHSPGAQFMYRGTTRLSRRDLNPEWGGTILGHYEDGRDITGTGQEGTQFSIDGVGFMPGLSKHHSFYHQLAYEKQRDDNYQYSSFVQRPRGTRNFFLEEHRKWSANYLAPLFYPDWHWSRYFYLKRVYANLFYDELNGRLREFSYKSASTGWEVMTEFNIFRLFIPLTVGIRQSYVLRGSEKSENFELFLTSYAGTF